MNLFDAAYKIIYPDEYNFSAGTKTVSKLDVVNGKFFIPGLASKSASEVDNFVKTIKPDKKHSYIHLISLGAMEWYGPNKRGDAFNESSHEYRPPEPCNKDAVKIDLEGGLKEFHNPTFMANGKVYREHHSILSGGEPQGDVVFATYNEPMHRGELIIRLDNDKWADDIEKIEKGEPTYYSIGALVANDLCSICGKRVSPKSPDRCEHLKHMVLTIDDKGNQVKAITDHPIFYDISRVARPADKIAFSLAKVASEGTVNTCELNVMPVTLVDTLNNRMRVNRLELLQKIAAEESSDLKTQLPVKLVDDEDEDIIKKIKQEDVPKVIFILKQHRAVLPPPAFIRLVGGEGTAIDDAMPLIGENLEGIFGKILNSPCVKDFIEDGTYEGEENSDRDLLETVLPLINKYSLDDQPVQKRIIRIVFSPSAKQASEKKIVTPIAQKIASELAKEYARYQLAFLTKNRDLGSIRLTLANNHANVII